MIQCSDLGHGHCNCFHDFSRQLHEIRVDFEQSVWEHQADKRQMLSVRTTYTCFPSNHRRILIYLAACQNASVCASCVFYGPHCSVNWDAQRTFGKWMKGISEFLTPTSITPNEPYGKWYLYIAILKFYTLYINFHNLLIKDVWLISAAQFDMGRY